MKGPKVSNSFYLLSQVNIILSKTILNVIKLMLNGMLLTSKTVYAASASLHIYTMLKQKIFNLIFICAKYNIFPIPTEHQHAQKMLNRLNDTDSRI